MPIVARRHLRLLLIAYVKKGEKSYHIPVIPVYGEKMVKINFYEFSIPHKSSVPFRLFLTRFL